MKKNNSHPSAPDYYQTIYHFWYRRFSHLYDPFLKVGFFLCNGGFGGELRARQKIVAWVAPRPGESIIDICCGTGTLTLLLARRLAGGGAVFGIDLSAAQLKVARKKNRPGEVYFLQGDARAIPFCTGFFHKGVISGALHEVPAEARDQILREAHRVIRPGGRLVVVEHNDPPKKWKRELFGFLERFNPEYPTYRDLLERGLTSEIEKGGFQVARTEVVCWDFFQMVSAVRVD